MDRGRNGLYKRISLELNNVTEEVCQHFVFNCKIRQLKRSTESNKSLRLPEIYYLLRGKIDLIEFLESPQSKKIKY